MLLEYDYLISNRLRQRKDKPMARKSADKPTEDTDVTVEAEPKIKHPVPDGYETPSNFALYVKHNKIWDGTPAQIFNFTKGAFAEQKKDKDGNLLTLEDGSPDMTTPNGFPVVVHSDGRKIIERANGIEWLQEYSIRRAHARQVAAQRAEARNQSVILSVGRYTLTAKRVVFARQTVNELATIAD